MRRTSRTARRGGAMRMVGVLVCALSIVATLAGVALSGGGIPIPAVGTWKVGLLPGDSAESTIAALPKDLAVLALQDIFLDEDGLNAFKSALGRSYPFSYHVPPGTPHDLGCVPYTPQEFCLQVTGLNTTDCVPQVAYGLLQCLQAAGSALDRLTLDALLTIPQCTPLTGALLVLDNQCPACLINAGAETGGNVDDTWATCITQKGPRYAHGGSVGQLILSKLPIGDVQTVEFPSYIERRANIYASIGGVRYGFASYPHDFGFPPPIFLPGALQPELAQEMIASDADVLLGSFSSGTQYQPAAYNALLQGFRDLAPGMLTQCTQAMIDAQDPRCCFPGGFCLFPSDPDHVLVRDGHAGCFRPDAPKLFAETTGVSDHAGLRVCRKAFGAGGFPFGNILR